MVEKTAKYASQIVQNPFRFLMKSATTPAVELEDAIEEFREEASVFGGEMMSDGSCDFSFLPPMSRSITDLPNYEKAFLNQNDLKMARMLWFVDESYASRISISKEFLDSIRVKLNDNSIQKNYDDILAYMTAVLLGIDEEWIIREYMVSFFVAFDSLVHTDVLRRAVLERIPECTEEENASIRKNTIDAIFAMTKNAFMDLDFLPATKYAPRCLNMSNDMVRQFLSPMVETWRKELGERVEYYLQKANQIDEAKENLLEKRDYIDKLFADLFLSEQISFGIPNDRTILDNRNTLVNRTMGLMLYVRDSHDQEIIALREELVNELKNHDLISYYFYLGFFGDSAEAGEYLRLVCNAGIKDAYVKYANYLDQMDKPDYLEIKRICELALDENVSFSFDRQNLFYLLGSAYEYGPLSIRDYKKALVSYENAYNIEAIESLSKRYAVYSSLGLARIYYYKYDVDLYTLHWLMRNLMLCETYGFNFYTGFVMDTLKYMLRNFEDPFIVLPIIGHYYLNNQTRDEEIMKALDTAGYYFDEDDQILKPKKGLMTKDKFQQYQIITKLFTKQYLNWKNIGGISADSIVGAIYSGADALRNNLLQSTRENGEEGFAFNVNRLKEQVLGDLTDKSLYLYQNGCLVLMSEPDLPRDKYLMFLGDAYLADGKENEALEAFMASYYCHGMMEFGAATRLADFFTYRHPECVNCRAIWPLLTIGAFLKTNQDPAAYINACFENKYFEGMMPNNLIFSAFQGLYLRYVGNKPNEKLQTVREFYQQEWLPDEQCYISRKYNAEMNDFEIKMSHFWENVTPEIGDYCRPVPDGEFNMHIEDAYFNSIRNGLREECQKSGLM